MRDITLADVFGEHVKVLLRDPTRSPRQKIQDVQAATKELETAEIVFPRLPGRPSNAARQAEKSFDPFLTPVLALARQKAVEDGVKALRASGDSAAQYAADLLEHGAVQDGG